jgi:benzoylformate decarboxylase
MYDQEPDTQLISVLDATRQVMRQLGMTTVFGNPGSTEIPFLRDWPADFDYVLGLQEASVLAMADGYAQATGSAAFINLHSAAGLGHAMGNLMTAYRNNSPLVIVAGQQTRSLLAGQPYLYAESAAEFPKPYVKWSCEPARAEDVPAAIARAYHVAMTAPCGPAFVSVPADDWEVLTQAPQMRRVSQRVAPDPVLLAELCDALAESRKPALVVGAQLDREHCWAEVIELAERTGAAVWEAPRAYRCAFPEDHPQFAGFLPPGPEALSRALSPYDLVVVLGAPVFTFHIPGQAAIFSGATRLFQITEDPTAAAWAGVGTAICGSLSLSLPAVLERTPQRPGLSVQARPAPADPSPSVPMTPDYVMQAIARHAPADLAVVEEAPSHRGAMQRRLPIRRPASFYTMASGALGYSLPAAVGVSLAQPSRPVMCLIGDGSTMYSPQALWTAVQRRLPIVFVVMNNGGYGAMRAFSRLLGGTAPPGIDLPGLDFVMLAASMGCPGARADDPASLESGLAAAFAAKSPFLLDISLGKEVADLRDI